MDPVPELLEQLRSSAAAYNAACSALTSIKGWNEKVAEAFLEGAPAPVDLSTWGGAVVPALDRAYMESLVRAPVSIRSYTERDRQMRSVFHVLLIGAGRELFSCPEGAKAADLVGRPTTGVLAAASFFRGIDTDRVRDAVTTGWIGPCQDAEVIRLGQSLERFFDAAHRYFQHRVATVETTIAPAFERAQRELPVLAMP